MKKVLILSILSISNLLYSCTNSVHSQTLTLKELIKLTECKEFDCYNSFVVKKGFSFSQSEETPSRYYFFSSNDPFTATSNSKVTPHNGSFIGLHQSGAVDSGFITAVSEVYQSLLSQVNSAGFSQTDYKKINNGVDTGVVTTYTNKKMPSYKVELQVDTLNKDGETWTSYSIQVTKL